ncbi:hypothetical protein LPB140_11735 [Sphingorhabdus lutea]|uniref:DUF11 domain-containing protein n=1 Tax=Sphingorhabdus lutea TaxID=1913578 RepID=A0A1L3JDY1_9SPHN|nr:hypothetical protein [Sphingorhabdus lutea]APG63347.1 hypothetical protein LPB140_11735 [Sphingorhabdus lutea]
MKNIAKKWANAPINWKTALQVPAYATALLLAAGSGIVMAQHAHAAMVQDQSDVVLNSSILVEKSEIDANGNAKITLKTPKETPILPGDKLRITLNYENRGALPVEGFTANNKVHDAVQLVEIRENWAIITVDGGKNWGKLSDLTVEEVNEETGEKIVRPAIASDVTHIRWTFPESIAPKEKGTLEFTALVR